MNSFECLLPCTVLDVKDFLQINSLRKSFTQIYFTDCHIIFFVILLGIKQLNKLWKKTFLTIHQLSCFVGHPAVCNQINLRFSYLSVKSKLEELRCHKVPPVITNRFYLLLLFSLQWGRLASRSVFMTIKRPNFSA